MSIALNGTTQALERTASVFDQNGDYTWSAWYRFASVQSGAFFHSAGANSANPVANVDYCQVQSTTTRIGAKDSAGTDIDFNDGSNTFSVDTWYYVTLQRTGTTLRAYVRPGGGSTALTVTITATDAGRAAAALMVVGRRGTNDRYHACQVAYMRLHQSVLTTGQIDAEAVSPTAVITANLWGSWKLTNSSTLTDDSGNGRDLTGVNSPTTGANEPGDVVVGPTVTVQPTAQTARINGESAAAATFTSTATGTGTVDATAEIESGVGTGTYGTLANGSGATWSGLTGTGSGSATATPIGTFSATTLTGRRLRIKFEDDNGTTYSNAVTLTVKTGPVLSAYSGTGVGTINLTSDEALGTGYSYRVTVTPTGFADAVKRSHGRST